MVTDRIRQQLAQFSSVHSRGATAVTAAVELGRLLAGPLAAVPNVDSVLKLVDEVLQLNLPKAASHRLQHLRARFPSLFRAVPCCSCAGESSC